MREMALWISGAALAFFVTAGAFLLLANLATVPSEESLTPDPASKRSGPDLELNLDEGRLASLKALPGQGLGLKVKNVGEEDLSDVKLTLGVSSENTAISESRYYHHKVEALPAGESVPVRFEFDLSSFEQARGPTPRGSSRKILEVRASTPEGVPAVRTVILPR